MKNFKIILLAIWMCVSCSTFESINKNMNFRVDDSPVRVKNARNLGEPIETKPEKAATKEGDEQLGPKAEENNKVSVLEGYEPSTLMLSPENPFGEEGEYKISFEEMPLKDFIHEVFGEMLKVNYVMDPALGDPSRKFPAVTLSFKDPVNARQLYEIALDTLNKNSFIVYAREKTYYLEYSNRKVNKVVTVAYGKSLSDVPETSGSIVQIVPLTYANNAMVSTMVRDLAGITPLSSNGNTLLVKGYKSDVEKVMKMIEFFDKPSAYARHIRLLRLTYIPMEDFEAEVTKILETEGIKVGDSPIKFSKLAYLNALVIHSSEEALIKRVLYWAKYLDVPVEGEEKQYFLYRPKFRDVESLSQSLEQLLSLQGDAQVQSGFQSSGQAQLALPAQQAAATPGTVQPNRPSSQQGTSGNTGGSVRTENLSMVADLKQNTIVFYTTPVEYKKLLPMLKQMDRLPPQIMIEATIAEVTLVDQFAQGVEWFLKKGGYSIGTLGSLGLSSGSLNYNVVGDGGDFIATVSLLESKNLVNILSNPRVVMSAGETANINVGTEIPILQSEAGGLDPDSTQTVQSVTYRSTGVTLDVTATITGQGIANLKIEQTVSEAGENTISSLDSPTILNRSITTSVLARDNQTIILGGLIQENNSKKRNSVPWIGDIPYLGTLFESHSETKTKTELIVLLTPRIIESATEFNELSNIFQEDYSILKFDRLKSKEKEEFKKNGQTKDKK
ncbi:MAG: hypothetical protein NE334_10545 [Lentisphaeraceae bacterium]|nr:hypothetical protein [Lentisphaeraceae bacterium]